MLMTPGLIQVVMNLLPVKDQSDKITEAALGLLGNIATHPDNRAPLFQIPKLVDSVVSCARHASSDIKQAAIVVLSSLSDEEENAGPLFNLPGLVVLLADALKNSRDVELNGKV